jgi:cell division protein FtsL
MNIKQKVIVFAAIALLMVSAVSSAYSVHLTRQYVGKLSELNRQQNYLQVEWEKLLLEINTLAGYNRIEATAIKRLGMQAPKPEQLRVIKLESELAERRN